MLNAIAMFMEQFKDFLNNWFLICNQEMNAKPYKLLLHVINLFLFNIFYWDYKFYLFIRHSRHLSIDAVDGYKLKWENFDF